MHNFHQAPSINENNSETPKAADQTSSIDHEDPPTINDNGRNASPFDCRDILAKKIRQRFGN